MSRLVALCAHNVACASGPPVAGNPQSQVFRHTGRYQPAAPPVVSASLASRSSPSMCIWISSLTMNQKDLEPLGIWTPRLIGPGSVQCHVAVAAGVGAQCKSASGRPGELRTSAKAGRDRNFVQLPGANVVDEVRSGQLHQSAEEQSPKSTSIRRVERSSLTAVHHNPVGGSW